MNWGEIGFLVRNRESDLASIYKFGSRSFWSLLVYILLLIFTWLLLFLRNETEVMYYTSRMVYDSFYPTFSTITDENGVYDFLLNVVAVEISNPDQSGDTHQHLRALSDIVGPIRLRQLRTKETKWAKYFSELSSTCYSTDYNSGTKYTGDIWAQGYEWCSYQSSSQTKINRKIYGTYQ